MSRKKGPKRIVADKLNVDVDALPPDAGSWTKADLQQLRRERPEWLTAARRERTAAEQRQRQERDDAAIAFVASLNVSTTPDLGANNGSTVGAVDYSEGMLRWHGFTDERAIDAALAHFWPRYMSEAADEAERELLN